MDGRPLSVRPLLLQRAVFGLSEHFARAYVELFEGRAPEKGAATGARPLRAYAGAADSQRASSALQPVEPLVDLAERGEDLLFVGRLAVLVVGGTPRSDELDIFRYRHILSLMARSSTTSDVFNAIAESRRREILDVLIAGEKPVGGIVDELSMSQPQVSKHLRVLSEVGLVSSRADGRRRLYSLEPASLQPFQEWLAKYEQALNERLDRMNDYLKDLQQQGEPK
jgi:DNA-binding transcriptional ArsR family regulator